jgi:hypothetical protein
MEKPTKINRDTFYDMITENPSVFKDWNTPLEITEFVDCCRDLKLTHLSPYLTFSGKNEDGVSADFSHCPKLKIATGTFHGTVWFNESAIETIENLEVKGTDDNGVSGYFWYCDQLKTASGKYEGCADFSESAIESIQNLHIETTNSEGYHVDFSNCKNLKRLDGFDISKKIRIEPQKLKAETNRRKSLKTFIKKSQPDELPFL